MRPRRQLLEHKGVYHPMWLAAPHPPDRQAWFLQTCADAEAFVKVASIEDGTLPTVSAAIHLAADHLFLLHRAEAAWSKLDPDALARHLYRQMGPVCGRLLASLGTFYAFLAETSRVDTAHGQAVSERLIGMTTETDEKVPQSNRARA